MQFLKALNKAKKSLSKHFKFDDDNWDRPYVDATDKYWRLGNYVLYIYETKKAKKEEKYIYTNLDNIGTGSILIAIPEWNRDTHEDGITYIFDSRKCINDNNVDHKKGKVIIDKKSKKKESSDDESSEEESDSEGELEKKLKKSRDALNKVNKVPTKKEEMKKELEYNKAQLKRNKEYLKENAIAKEKMKKMHKKNSIKKPVNKKNVSKKEESSSEEESDSGDESDDSVESIDEPVRKPKKFSIQKKKKIVKKSIKKTKGRPIKEEPVKEDETVKKTSKEVKYKEVDSSDEEEGEGDEDEEGKEDDSSEEEKEVTKVAQTTASDAPTRITARSGSKAGIRR